MQEDNFSYSIKVNSVETLCSKEDFEACLMEVVRLKADKEFDDDLDDNLEPLVDKLGISFPASYIIKNTAHEDYQKLKKTYAENLYKDLYKRLYEGKEISINKVIFKISSNPFFNLF